MPGAILGAGNNVKVNGTPGSLVSGGLRSGLGCTARHPSKLKNERWSCCEDATGTVFPLGGAVEKDPLED